MGRCLLADLSSIVDKFGLQMFTVDGSVDNFSFAIAQKLFLQREAVNLSIDRLPSGYICLSHVLEDFCLSFSEKASMAFITSIT